jgi:sigma-B regulation protein RsbU (phosphoserine phosphatase)
MPAALLAAAVCPEVRHAVQAAASPAEVLTRVNRHVCNSGFDARFVTMILAELDTQQHRITIANAGHELPLIRHANGSVEQLDIPGSGMPLGIAADTVYESTLLELKPGEVVIFNTDGLIDARDRKGSRFGIERVLKILSSAPGNASLAGEALLEAVMVHSEGVAPFDDLTLVCIGRETN